MTMTDRFDRIMADQYNAAMTWYRDKVDQFIQQGNNRAAEAVEKEYNLWPSRPTFGGILKTDAQSIVDTLTPSKDFIAALIAATRFMAPNVTLKEAAYHTSARSHWNLAYKIIIHPASNPAATLGVFKNWLEREVPGSKVKYAQKHDVRGEHYWKVEVEVPVG